MRVEHVLTDGQTDHNTLIIKQNNHAKGRLYSTIYLHGYMYKLQISYEVLTYSKEVRPIRCAYVLDITMYYDLSIMG